MKKVLLLFLLLPSLVSAAEYTDFKEYTGEVNLNDSNIKVERRYKYYKINNVLGPYELEEVRNEEYPLIDYNDYIYSDYSDWTFEIKDKEFETKEVYKYQTIQDTNKILLEDFSNPDYYVDITSIDVLYDGKKVPYEFSCTFCGKDFYKTLTEEGHAKMETNGKVVLSLGKEYETKKLSVLVNYISNNTYVTWISAKYKNEDVINAEGQVLESGVLGEATLKVDCGLINLKNENKIIYSDFERDDLTFVSKETMYRYREKLYRKYKKEKIYTDYLSYVPKNYIKDENLYKDFYAYKILEKNNQNLSVQISDSQKQNDKIKENSNIRVVEENIKLDSNNTIENKDVVKENKKSKQLDYKGEKPNYNFLYLFLIIPFLLLIKIILVLSKLYKSHKKSGNL